MTNREKAAVSTAQGLLQEAIGLLRSSETLEERHPLTAHFSVLRNIGSGLYLGADNHDTSQIETARVYARENMHATYEGYKWVRVDAIYTTTEEI
jgi:hypothetical protein